VKRKLRFLTFSVVVEICLLWGLIQFILGNEPATGSQGFITEATVACSACLWSWLVFKVSDRSIKCVGTLEMN